MIGAHDQIHRGSTEILMFLKLPNGRALDLRPGHPDYTRKRELPSVEREWIGGDDRQWRQMPG